jgi:hypothetical protein
MRRIEQPRSMTGFLRDKICLDSIDGASAAMKYAASVFLIVLATAALFAGGVDSELGPLSDSTQFEQLPTIAKTAIYARLWNVLAGKGRDRRYAYLSAADRSAVVEILPDTKPDLPSSFTHAAH